MISFVGYILCHRASLPSNVIRLLGAVIIFRASDLSALAEWDASQGKRLRDTAEINHVSLCTLAKRRQWVIIQAFYTVGIQFDHDHMLNLELHVSLFQKQSHKNVSTLVG